MERFDRVMTEITGSTGDAQKALDATNEIVKGTAYGLDTAAQAVQNFATRGIEVEKATGYMEAFGDAVAFYGDGSNEQLTSVSDALSKMVTKGTVEMDQLNRLFDVGIDAVGMYATATGQSASDVQDALSAGEISSVDFIDVVTEAMTEGTNGVTNIAGAAKEAGASWSGSFANMRAAVARGVTNIIENIDEMLTSNGLPDMREMVANFGSAFETALTQAGELIGPFITKLIEIYNSLKPWMPLIAGIVGAFLTFNIVISVINGVRAAVMSFRGAMMALNTTMLANPVVLVIAVLAGLAVMFVLLWKNSETFRSVVTNVFNSLKSVVMPVIQAIVDFVMTVWGTLVAWWDASSAQILATAQTIWNTIVTVIMTVVNAVVTFVMEIWAGLVAFWQEHGQMILEAAMNVWTVIQTVIMTVVTVIWTIIQTMATIVMGIMQFLWPFIQALIISTWEAIKGVIQGAIDVITGIIQFFAALFTGNWSALWDSVKQIVTGAVKLVWNLVQLWFVGKILKAGKALFTGLRGIVTNLWNAIKSLFTAGVNVARNVVTTGFNFIRNIVSTVMNAIRSVISSIWNGIRSTISNVVNSIRSTISNIFNSLRGIVSGAFNAVRNAVRTGITGALNVVKNMASQFLSAGKNIVTSIADGIKGAIGSVTGAIGDVASKIRGFLPFSPAKEGPLRDIMDIQIGESIAKSIDKGKNAAARSMASLTSAVNSEMPVVDIAGQAAKSNANIKSSVNHEMSGNNARMENLLNKIANSNQVIVLDSGELVGATYNEYDRTGGNKTALTERWGR